MYRDRLWTMRQYAGYATAEETNTRYRYLIEHGSTGLSMAFDLPTQLGRDSDDPLCRGEVGRTGVAIDTIEDMRICFDQIPLGEVSTSMTINAPAAILLLLYELVGEENDVKPEQLRGTVQNDVLKEYVSRGNYIFPPEPTMRLTTDIFAYCDENIPSWNTISISGYHMREKGCSAVQEVAFTLANAIAYVQAGLDAGLEIDRFGKRLAFFFNCHNNVFQEIAKFRAARRMWAKIMRERFGASDENALRIRFHTQTGGVTLQAQQPEVNIIRVALQGFAAVAGGTQSLHTNGFDEALALPSERSARIALRTQQVLAHESGVADTVDPFAGSYFVEALTDEIEQRSWELMEKVEEMGGSVQALEFMQREIEESAASYEERYRTEQDIVVGVNKYVTDQVDDVEILKVDPESEQRQLRRASWWRASRRRSRLGWPGRLGRLRLAVLQQLQRLRLAVLQQLQQLRLAVLRLRAACLRHHGWRVRVQHGAVLHAELRRELRAAVLRRGDGPVPALAVAPPLHEPQPSARPSHPRPGPGLATDRSEGAAVSAAVVVQFGGGAPKNNPARVRAHPRCRTTVAEPHRSKQGRLVCRAKTSATRKALRLARSAMAR